MRGMFLLRLSLGQLSLQRRALSSRPLLLSMRVMPPLLEQLFKDQKKKKKSVVNAYCDSDKHNSENKKLIMKTKAKVKISRHAVLGLQEVKKAVEKTFPVLQDAHYQIRYLVGDEMKIPRWLATEDIATQALQSSLSLNTALRLFIHPDPHQRSAIAPKLTGPLEYLEDMLNPDLSPTFTLVSFYRFCNVSNPEETVDLLRELWSPFKVFGRVYVAEEGVNAQMAIPTNVLRHFEMACRTLDLFRDSPYASPETLRINCDSHEISTEEYYSQTPFRALHIRRRRQVLVDGLPSPLDWNHVKDEVDPLEWHHRVSPTCSSSPNSSGASAPIILDCRNKYETDVGRFDGAIPLNTNTFQESWAALEDILKDKDPSTPIMTYCTGGIRCVKINGYLNQKMGFHNTSRLKGGIIAYARQRKDWEAEQSASGGVDGTAASKFKGVNYVFDDRMGERITDDVLANCQNCGTPHDMFSNCKNCSVRFLQCKSCAFDLASCCSEECKDKYLTYLGEKESRIAQRQERAKLLQQSKQRREKRNRKNNSASFGALGSSPSLPRRKFFQSSMKFSTFAGASRVVTASRCCYYSNLTVGGDDAILNYCENFSSPEPSILSSLRAETLVSCPPSAHRMLCDPLQGQLLSLLSHLQRPSRVLELGTFTGYSAICLAEGLVSRGNKTPMLVTVDSDEATARIARKYLQEYETSRNDKAAKGDHINMNLIVGKGLDVLMKLRKDDDERFDIAFIDANKKGYIEYLQVLMGERPGDHDNRALLSKNALVIVDNTLWKGMVVDAMEKSGRKSTSEGRDRMQELAKVMHEFNAFCNSHQNLHQVILPIRDGLSLMRYHPKS